MKTPNASAMLIELLGKQSLALDSILANQKIQTGALIDLCKAIKGSRSTAPAKVPAPVVVKAAPKASKAAVASPEVKVVPTKAGILAWYGLAKGTVRDVVGVHSKGAGKPAVLRAKVGRAATPADFAKAVKVLTK